MGKIEPNGFRLIKDRPARYDMIGDVHGCYDELIKLIEKLGYQKKGNHYVHPENRILVSVGDVADKGPKNLKSLKFWMDQVIYGQGLWVYGNHCNKFYRYLRGNKVKLSHGLQNTAAEWKRLSETEQQRWKKRFFSVYHSLAYYYLLDGGNLLVVHGGIKKEWIGKFHSKIRTMCIYGDITGEFDLYGRPIRRDWAEEYDGKTFIVYGHTVVEKAEMKNKTIDIDQGCVYGGYLTAFRYPEMEIVQVKGKKYAEYRGEKKNAEKR